MRFALPRKELRRARGRELVGVALAASLIFGVVVTPLASAQPAGPNGNIPIPPAALEQQLKFEPFEIRSVKGAGGGVTGAKKLTLYFPGTKRELKVKWKPVPPRGDGWNNSPRRELAAYELQKWFLDPEDFVVPTTVARCIPLDVYAPVDPAAQPNVGSFPCVLGVLSIWLSNVTVPDELYDVERFADDPKYARHIASFNMLTYLVAHKDGRTGNFLTSSDETDRRVFAVDNGISFGGMVHNWFVRNWHKIRVAGLRKEHVDRLRGLDRRALDQLSVVAQLHPDANGILRSVEPTASVHPTKGVYIADDVVQLGLTSGQLEDLHDRIVVLVADVDRGVVPTF